MVNLRAVFWDYPQYIDENYLRLSLSIKDTTFRLWVIRRFLENGRAIDTLSLFPVEEINKAVHHLKLTGYTRKKWNRLIEVYGSERK